MTAKIRRKRRWWRFRLSSLLIVFTLLSVWLAIKFQREPLSLANLSQLQKRERIDVDIWKVVWSPDGRRIALVGWEKPVEIRESVTLWRTKTIGEGKKIIHFAFSPDENIVAYCENGKEPNILDLSTGQEKELKTVAGQSYVDASIGLWNIETGELLHVANTTAEEIYTLDWSPNGEMLASAGLRGDINLWDATDLSLLHTLPAPEWVISIRFRADGRGLVTAGGSFTPGGKRYVHEWDVPSFVSRLVRK